MAKKQKTVGVVFAIFSTRELNNKKNRPRIRILRKMSSLEHAPGLETDVQVQE